MKWGACLVCGCAAEPVEICRTSFAGIARCGNCGLVRTWPPRTQAELARLHADPAYFHHPYFAARRDLQHPSRQREYQRILHLLAAGRPSGGRRLLDVGCDTGARLVIARDQFGLDVTGVEVSPAAAAVARRSYHLPVIEGDVSDVELASESFDYIMLVDLLEHTADPLALVRAGRRFLRPGGKIYIVTPDHDAVINLIGQALYRLLKRRSWPLLERLYIPYHEFYFTKPTLVRLVEQAGLRVTYHRNREFPLAEFGQGFLLQLALAPIFALQKVVGRQTLQELVAVK